MIAVLVVSAVLMLFGRRIIAVVLGLCAFAFGATAHYYHNGETGRDKAQPVVASAEMIHFSGGHYGDVFHYNVENTTPYFLDKVSVRCVGEDWDETFPIATLAPNDSHEGHFWTGKGYIQNSSCKVIEAKGYKTLPGWDFQSGKLGGTKVEVSKTNS